MQVTKSDLLQIRNEADVVQARQAVRRWATEQAFPIVDQTKIVTAASELARNTLVYGRGGTVRLEALNDGARKGLRLTFEDQGPGIANLQQALQDGYSTGGGLGLGLSGARRLSNEFHIESELGKGTRVMIARWR
ncbi:MAG TPA: anti-sigma regulatory factor [Verrucomicrobiae bacterium]